MKFLIVAVTLLFASHSSLATGFKDRDLQKYLGEQPNGIIYIWSPAMPLSVQGRFEAEVVAAKMGLSFKALVDPIQNGESDQKVESTILLNLSILNHFPAVVFHRNGKVLPSILFGYEVPAGLKKYIQTLSVEKKERPSTQLTTAQVTPTPAEKIQLKVKSEHLIEARPSYFFRVPTSGNYLAYLNGRQNFLYTVGSKVLTPIPGSFDPVFMVEEDYLVTPTRAADAPDGKAFYGIYKLEELLTKGMQAAPMIKDYDQNGVYQSVGFLRKVFNQKFYRMITEGQGAHYYKDYKLNIKTGNFAPPEKLNDLCKNQSLKLPMLSKDGKELGAFDLKTNTSGIFKIRNENCEKVYDFGVKTGKMNFSFDGNLVAYHNYDRVGFIDSPETTQTSNIYILDRRTNKIFQATQNTNANDLYPDFLPDGTLVFVHYPHAGTNVTFTFANFELN